MAEPTEGPAARCIVLGCRRDVTWVERTYTSDGEHQSDGHWLCELHTQ
ncbi:hypothetical protein [Williamsia sp. D3]|nr:hypothetical protein [Williamsia sp. D3]